MAGRLRAVFFDAGNTLIFPRVEDFARDLTEQGFHATAEDFFASERAGKQKLDEWLWPQIRAGQLPRMVDMVYWTEYLRVLMERIGVPEATRQRVMLHVGDRFRDIRSWSTVDPATSGFLDGLRARGYYLGVISNSVGTMEEQLGRLDLARHFDTILDSAVVGVEKPHPEIFHMALGRAKLQASEAIFIGDTYATDIGGASLVGLQGVLIDRVGAYSKVDCPRITALAELGPILEELEQATS